MQVRAWTMGLLLGSGIAAAVAGDALSDLIGAEAAQAQPALMGRALTTFLEAEDRYRAGRYADARRVLEALWAQAPPGSDAWVSASRAARRAAADHGLNIGNPPCYYALRMLNDCVNWRLKSEADTRHDTAPRKVRLTVVLVGTSRGVEPTNRDDLNAGEGRQVVHTLDPKLLENDFGVVHQSLWLFREYMLASTEGQLGVGVTVVHLSETSAAVSCRAKGVRYAGLDEGAAGIVAKQVPANLRNATDWWWVIYPSHVPEHHPDFTRTGFVTGGMGVGPDGGSPCFIIDDRWLTRKPPHIGLGPYGEVERRAYLPQWVQHEFMHHLFRIYPSFELEAKSHQWFDRSTWPEDFKGRFEADYYAEAMARRLRTGRARPPMRVALRYTPPPRPLLERIVLEDMVGDYRHDPVQNDWHIGRITVDERDERGRATVLRWRNKAGVSWRLLSGPEPGLLATDKENPYYASNPTGGRHFRILPRRDAHGEYRADPVGFRFQSGIFRRQITSAHTEQYEPRSIEGWTVMVNRRLLAGQAELGRRALRLLETKLYEIGRSVPPEACTELRKVVIWLGVDDGHAPCAEYHPSRGFLAGNGYSPEKAKGVELGCAEKLLAWSKQQPMMVLHELAHAYHDQCIGHDNTALLDAYKAAVDRADYDHVLHCSGRRKRAYAMANVKEYFAELTECLFGTNDFYPFVRAELRVHDPAGFEAVEALWQRGRTD